MRLGIRIFAPSRFPGFAPEGAKVIYHENATGQSEEEILKNYDFSGQNRDLKKIGIHRSFLNFVIKTGSCDFVKPLP